MSSGILVFIEHRDGVANKASLEGIAAAQSLASQLQQQVTAVVEDNGSGFNVDDALNNSNSRTIGLTTLRERTEMLGGSLNIQSSVGQGTRVEFVIPIDDTEAYF